MAKRRQPAVQPYQQRGYPAILGGPHGIPDHLAPFDKIGKEEREQMFHAMNRVAPLSGYMGGKDKGGYYVEMLEYRWAEAFNCRYAVAVNSATSGLLTAAAAVDLRPGDEFIVSPYTMSATAAAPMFTGADPSFVDVEPLYYCLDPEEVRRKTDSKTRAIFVTNLFGHPAALTALREFADEAGIFLIEDNAQSPFAMEGKKFAGTIGHIGVFSLNVHKHIQCGEGGVCVTDNETLAMRMREFRNHGELFPNGHAGLNLRMTEMTAALALVQLEKAPKIIPERIDSARQLMMSIEDRDIPGITLPKVRDGCVHVYYTVPLLFDSKVVGCSRDQFLKALYPEFRLYKSYGIPIPIQGGYVKPLYHLPAFQKFASPCPVAEELHNESLMYFENCAWTPTMVQYGQIAKTLLKLVEAGQAGVLNDV